MSTPRGEVTVNSKEIWSLGEGGQVLTIALTTTTPRGDNTLTLKYRKEAS